MATVLWMIYTMQRSVNRRLESASHIDIDTARSYKFHYSSISKSSGRVEWLQSNSSGRCPPGSKTTTWDARPLYYLPARLLRMEW